MKFYLFLISAFLSIATLAQRNTNYKFTINTTFTANENFGDYDEFWDETDWSLIVPRALLIRNGFDVQVAKRLAVGLNFGFDWHPDLEVLAFPYYVDTKYALVQVDDDKLYFSGGAGKLLKFGNAFTKGNYYKFGLGYHISTLKNYSIIFDVDFHQKKIKDFENGKLNSLSFGLGMIFL